jgi:hypothetical protein
MLVENIPTVVAKRFVVPYLTEAQALKQLVDVRDLDMRRVH